MFNKIFEHKIYEYFYNTLLHFYPFNKYIKNKMIILYNEKR